MKMTRINKGRLLAKLLRWDKPGCYEKGGWRATDEILEKLYITMEELQELVVSDPKNQSNPGRGRYEFSEDLSQIRARDGHAKWVPVTAKEPADVFPDVLFHGTSMNSVRRIMADGISSMERTYVHLSDDKIEALRVGSRHKNPVVLCIDSQAAVNRGHRVYPPESIAWLADEVPPEAISDSAYIGRQIAYFECLEQAEAVVEICRNRDSMQEVLEKFRSYCDSGFCPVHDIGIMSEITHRVLFEIDSISMCITAFVPIPTDADIAYYEKVQNHLDWFADALHPAFAAALLDRMPNVESEDRNRLQYYLKLALTRESGNCKHIVPIDPLEVRQALKTARRYWLYPPFIADSQMELLERVGAAIQEKVSGRDVISCLWIDIPDSCDDVSHMEMFVRKCHDADYELITGINHISGQDTYRALLFVTEKTKND